MCVPSSHVILRLLEAHGPHVSSPPLISFQGFLCLSCRCVRVRFRFLAPLLLLCLVHELLVVSVPIQMGNACPNSQPGYHRARHRVSEA
jgi:hypothetical protein